MKQLIADSIIRPCRKAAATLLDSMGLKSTIKRLFRATRSLGVPRSEPQILRVLPHDPAAFTQGLHIHNGIMYESTGIVGCSSLRIVERETGEILQKISVEDCFAEGIAAIGDRLVQLVWRSQQALVYRLPDLTLIDHYSYSGEGWGMTATAEHYLTSNGSDEIVYRDRHFNRVKSLKVRVNGFPLRGINDLAWAKGRIYCNVLHDSNIYEISAGRGTVLRILDCSRLAEAAAMPGSANVLNGIAYDPQTDTFFITGKRWRNLFQVRFTDFRRDERALP